MKELTRKVIDDYYKYKGGKKKSFRVVFEYRTRNGEVKQTRPRFKKKSEAEKRLAELIKKEAEANGVFTADKDQVLLKDYAERIYKPRMLERLSPTSHDNEKSRVDEVVNFFEFRTIASITRTDIYDYKAHLKKKVAKNAKKIDGESPTLSVASVNKYMTRFRAMLNEARRDYRGLLEFDFTGDIIQKKLETIRQLKLTFFEFDRISAACTGKQTKMSLLLIALWETGARLSEIAGNKKRLDYLPGVKREDIDLENQTIKLWNSKLHPGFPPSFRMAYLSESFRNALKDAGVENLKPDELVFPRGDFRGSWETILKRAGIDENFWEKDIRKCFTSNCDVAGVRDSAVKFQINHAGEDLLGRVYKNIRPDELKELFKPYEEYCRKQRDEVEKEKQKQQAQAASA
jgi:hypothetical protein